MIRNDPTNLMARSACGLALFASILGSTAPSPLYPHYIEAFQLEKVMGTAIFAFYAIGTLIALQLSGRIGSRLSDVRRILVPGLVVTALGAVIFAMADSLPMLLAGRFLNGFGTGAVTGLASAALYELAPEHKRHSAATVATITFTCGAAGGPLMTSAAMSADFAPTVFPFLTIAALLLLAIAGLCLSPWEKRKLTGSRAAGDPDTARTIMPLFVLACLGISVAWTLGSNLMALGTDLGLNLYHLPSVTLAGLIPAIFQLFAGIGQASFGRLPAGRAIGLGVCGIAVAQLLLVLTEIGSAGYVMLALIPLCGLSYGSSFVGALGLANLAADPALRGAWISRFYVVGYLSMSLPTLTVGYLSDMFGLRSAYFLFSAALVTMAIMALTLLLRCRQRGLLAH